ncbi:MAG: pyridoxamine 5'-phosphate oxidase family protein [Nitrososphaerota archaeon]
MEKNIVRLIKNTSFGYLATAASNLQPYATPVVFILHNNNIYVPLDQKPKTVSISELKRVKNIQENPKVCFLVHHYDEDWTKLWFVMITGYATLVNGTSKTLRTKLKTIHNKFLSKYSQYNKISVGSFYITIRIDKSTYWKYSQAK